MQGLQNHSFACHLGKTLVKHLPQTDLPQYMATYSTHVLSAKGKIWYSFLNPHLSQIIVEYAQIC
jgi:hypothetical protein